MATAIFMGLIFIAQEINPGSFTTTEYNLMWNIVRIVIVYDAVTLLANAYRKDK